MFGIFTFKGRLSRNGYWRFRWISVGIAMMAMVSFLLLAETVVTSWAWLVFPLAGAVLLLASLSTTVRRLHDRNRSGWWLLGFGLLPLLVGAGFYVSSLLAKPYSGWAFFGGFAVAMALSLWASIEVDFLPGTPGPNRFGAEPE